MEIIKYECKRCKKVVKAILHKAKFKKKSSRNKAFHYRLDCLECNKYIKFVGEKELSTLVIDPESIKEKPSVKRNKPDASITLTDLSFKLDLILDHLGIISEGPFVEDFRLGADRWEK